MASEAAAALTGGAAYDPEALEGGEEGLGQVWFVSITLLVVVLLGLLYHGYMPQFIRTVLPESALVLLIGIAAGGILSVDAALHAMSAFDPETFFHFLLPPIILYAGYSLEREHGHVFFSNIGTILALAVVGTLVSTCLVSLLCFAVAQTPVVDLTLVECFLFGALISATDPVACIAIFESMHVSDLLFNVVFGESVLNDAVAIVLYRAVNRFTDPTYGVTAGHIFFAVGEFCWISVGSFAIGVAFAALLTLGLKWLRAPEAIPTLLFFIFGYLCYMLAEFLTLSGIVTVLNFGIFMGHYGIFNMDDANQHMSFQLAKLIGVLLESLVFAYIGMSVFGVDGHRLNVGFTVLAILFCLVGRAANVFPLSALMNSMRKRKLPLRLQVVVWFSGLRGAIAFALSLTLDTPNADVIKTTALGIVLVTTVLVGGATMPLLEGLGIAGDGQEALSPAEREERDKVSTSKMWFLRLDRRFLFPFFVKRENIPDWVGGGGKPERSAMLESGSRGEGPEPAGAEGATSGTVELQLAGNRSVLSGNRSRLSIVSVASDSDA